MVHQTYVVTNSVTKKVIAVIDNKEEAYAMAENYGHEVEPVARYSKGSFSHVAKRTRIEKLDTEDPMGDYHGRNE